MTLKTVLQLYLNEICALLETYKGRDKVLRTICYSTKLIGGLHSNPMTAEKYLTISKQVSAARATLRLLDDLPMLKYSLEYGLGKQEIDGFRSFLGVLTNIIDQVYYPIEKMAWLAEHKIISGKNSGMWDTASSVFWSASIYLELTRKVQHIIILEGEIRDYVEHDDKPGHVRMLREQQRSEMLTTFRLTLDLVHAVNTLPRSWFWGETLNTWQVGFIATVSSVIGLYQIFANR